MKLTSGRTGKPFGVALTRVALLVAVTAAAGCSTVEPRTNLPVDRTNRRVDTRADTIALSPKDQVKRIIVQEADKLGISATLGMAVARAESNFNPLAESPVGARGVMQVMPATGKGEFNVEPDELWNPRTNIHTGLSYLQKMIKRYDGSWELALSAYNAGPGRVGPLSRAKVVPVTRGYINKVLGYEREFAAQTSFLAKLRSRGTAVAAVTPYEPAADDPVIDLPLPRSRVGSRDAMLSADEIRAYEQRLRSIRQRRLQEQREEWQKGRHSAALTPEPADDVPAALSDEGLTAIPPTAPPPMASSTPTAPVSETLEPVSPPTNAAAKPPVSWPSEPSGKSVSLPEDNLDRRMREARQQRQARREARRRANEAEIVTKGGSSLDDRLRKARSRLDDFSDLPGGDQDDGNEEW